MGGETVRVLLVEDDEDDYVLTRDLLAEAGPGRYDLAWAATYEAARETIGRGCHDVYLLDYRLGGRTGLELLREAIGRGCRAPLILLTGQDDRDVDLEAMRVGAADFLTKGRIDAATLDRALRYAVERKRAEDALRRMRDELEDRVRERTAELARANDELRAEVAERRRAEAALQAAKEAAEAAREAAEAANRAKDRFLAVLSHELRTPLTPVLLSVSALLDRPAEAGELRPALELVRRNVELEARLIDDLLDLTRIIRGKLTLNREPVDAHEVIRRAVTTCFGDPGARPVELELAAAEPRVAADPARFQQVVGHLLHNAVKFTPADGRVAVRTRNEPGPSGSRLIVEVADTGIGIEPDVLPRIFDAFAQGETTLTRRYGGLGLGLAISRAIAEAHGGTLVADSEGRDRGATFTIALPAEPTRAGSWSGPPPGPLIPALPQPLTILIVEDDPNTLRVLTRLLGRPPYRALAASSLAQALELAAAGDLDLIVSDIGLPDGTGWDLMRALRQRRAVPGIALSGFGTEQDRMRSREAGFATHLTKPVDLATLEATIRRVASAGGGGNAV